MVGLALTILAFLIVAGFSLRWVILPFFRHGPAPSVPSIPPTPNRINLSTGETGGKPLAPGLSAPPISVIEPEKIQIWIDEANQNLDQEHRG